MSNPSLRVALLREVWKFVDRAKDLSGVSRIALIGSLNTTKPRPKDADVLVTVSESMNLASLAAVGRKLKGAGQSIGSGADVFLCDVTGRYIGRTCSYRECHPRVRCRGKSCGIRSYLCDDLDELCLSQELVTQPPVVLWPQVSRWCKVPVDVEKHLLKPLEANQSTYAAQHHNGDRGSGSHK